MDCHTLKEHGVLPLTLIATWCFMNNGIMYERIKNRKGTGVMTILLCTVVQKCLEYGFSKSQLGNFHNRVKNRHNTFSLTIINLMKTFPVI